MNNENIEKWLCGVKKQTTDNEYALIKRAVKILEGNEYADSNAPWGERHCLLPDYDSFKGIWNWDTAFHSMGVSRFDTDFAIENIDTYLQFQDDDGMFPDAIFCDGRRSDNFAKPPVMATACEIVYKRSGDTEFLKRSYERLCRNEKFWIKHRCYKEMFFYDAAPIDGVKRIADMRNESGWDNSVRWDRFSINKLWPVDLNCYMVMTYRSLSYMAQEIGDDAMRQHWANKADTLAELIEERLWSDDLQMYADKNFETGEFSDVISPAIFMPMYINIASASRAEKMIHIAADRTKLFPGMPTVSYDNPEYGTDYWRGPTWLNTAYFAAKGILDYGYKEIANEIKKKILTWVEDDGEYIHENYNASTGEGLCAKHFSWSAVFVIEFILNWDN